jgi:predicted acetyltransferase
MLTLVAPDVALHASWLAAHREWGPGLHEDGFGIAAEDDVDTVEGFSRFVERVRTRPTARLWWVLDDDLVVGGIALRHADAPNVLKHGHLGYGVRPSWRGKGVATWALGEVLGRAPAVGLQQVLLVCLDDNVASIKTIEHHGGLLDEVVMHDGIRLRRYWIDLHQARRAAGG